LNETEVLQAYLKEKEYKFTGQRRQILEIFLITETHLSVEELYQKLKSAGATGIGLATVYRALKLFSEAGLARELQFGDGITRYEHQFGHAHHDHLVCIRCERVIEVNSKQIEELQEKLAKENHFQLLNHRMELYGICEQCK
jgi:Fur family ferric uptake transcriptional regulator